MKFPPSIKNFKTFCIIQTAFLGDVALTMPLANEIKKLNPDSKILFLTTPAAAELANCSKSVDETIVYDKRREHKGIGGLNYVSTVLMEKKVDCILAPHRSFRTSLLTLFTNPSYSIGYDINSLSFIYSKKIIYYKHLHELQRIFALLQGFDECKSIFPNKKYEKAFFYENLGKDDLKFSQHDINFIEDFLSLKQNKNNSILIAPGSVWQTKRWTSQHIIELCLKIKSAGFNAVLIGGEEDKELCESIKNQTEVQNLAGIATIPQILYLMTKSKLTITNDSAPTHFAGLAGCPTITIFGATSPMFGFAPWGQNDVIMELKDLACKPCSIHGSKTCPAGHFKCMNLLMPEMAFEAAMSILK